MPTDNGKVFQIRLDILFQVGEKTSQKARRKKTQTKSRTAIRNVSRSNLKINYKSICSRNK